MSDVNATSAEKRRKGGSSLLDAPTGIEGGPSPRPGAAKSRHAKPVPADLNVAQMEALFRAELRRCVSARTRAESAAAARSLWRYFRDNLRQLEAARASVRESDGACARLNELLEEDRRRLSHDLHDESGQLLASIHIALNDLHSEIAERSLHRLDEIRAQLDTVQDQVRRISQELSPTILEDFELASALRFMAEGVSARSGLDISVKASSRGRLPANIEMTLYRVVQEALNNAAKHAHASRVQIVLRRHQRSVACSIRDDGVGMGGNLLHAQGGHDALGLQGIRVRVAAVNGWLRIDSGPRTGTHVCISIPLEGGHAAAGSSR